jgi:hypothetical protein
MTSETDRQAGRQTDRPERITLGLVEPRHFGGVHTCTCSQQSDTEPCSALYTSKKLSLGKELQFADILQMHLLTCLSVSWTLYLYAFWVCGGNGIKYLARGKQRLSTCTGRLSEIMLPRERSPGNSPAALDGPCQATLVDTRTHTHYMWETCHGKIWEVWIVIHMHIVQIHACMHACRKTGYCTSMCSDGVTWWRWRRRDWHIDA